MKQPILEKAIAFILLTPSIITVISFFLNDFLELMDTSSIMADITYENHNGLSIWTGLLALAGVYLLRKNSNYSISESLRDTLSFLENKSPISDKNNLNDDNIVDTEQPKIK